MSDGTTTHATSSAPKWWAESLTIRGALLSAGCAVVPALGSLVGLELSADVVSQVGQQVAVAAQAVGGITGAAMTIIGRFRAARPLTRRAVQMRI